MRFVRFRLVRKRVEQSSKQGQVLRWYRGIIRTPPLLLPLYVTVCQYSKTGQKLLPYPNYCEQRRGKSLSSVEHIRLKDCHCTGLRTTTELSNAFAGSKLTTFPFHCRKQDCLLCFLKRIHVLERNVETHCSNGMLLHKYSQLV